MRLWKVKRTNICPKEALYTPVTLGTTRQEMISHKRDGPVHIAVTLRTTIQEMMILKSLSFITIKINFDSKIFEGPEDNYEIVAMYKMVSYRFIWRYLKFFFFRKAREPFENVHVKLNENFKQKRISLYLLL